MYVYICACVCALSLWPAGDGGDGDQVADPASSWRLLTRSSVADGRLRGPGQGGRAQMCIPCFVLKRESLHPDKFNLSSFDLFFLLLLCPFLCSLSSLSFIFLNRLHVLEQSWEESTEISSTTPAPSRPLTWTSCRLQHLPAPEQSISSKGWTYSDT